MSWLETLDQRFPGRCLREEPLTSHTTYLIGGKAEALVFPTSEDDWTWLLDFARRGGVPLTVLGHGSNVIVSDGGLRGIVASTRRMDGFTVSGNCIEAQCGAVLDAVVAGAVGAGLAGMELMSGIPGTIGGALWINAGAFGHETYDHLVSFTAMDREGRLVRRSKEGVMYGYRTVEGVEGLVFLSARWELVGGNRAQLEETRAATLKSRAMKQPLDFPSAGSVFKRPKVDYASRLIDSCSLKGLTVGGAQVSPKHAGFIVNVGGATARDVMTLVAHVRETVRLRTGVSLELEQVPLGF